MNVLELFAGSCSFSQKAKELGHNTFAVDIDDFEHIDLQANILDLKFSKIPFAPDIIWCSPPCTSFSVSSIGHHWTGGKGAYIPKTSKAYLGMALVKRCFEFIDHFKPKYWYIENPRGVLRKLDVVKGVYKQSVSFCKYGDSRMKPTDIWTNNRNWIPRAMCKNGATARGECHHEPAPRGSRTGTQGMKNAYHRAILPEQLCTEVIMESSSKGIQYDPEC